MLPHFVENLLTLLDDKDAVRKEKVMVSPLQSSTGATLHEIPSTSPTVT